MIVTLPSHVNIAETNFDLGISIEDFETEFGFLFAGENADLLNQTVYDHGENFDLEKFLEGELNEKKILEYIVLSEDSDHEDTSLKVDELPDLDM